MYLLVFVYNSILRGVYGQGRVFKGYILYENQLYIYSGICYTKFHCDATRMASGMIILWT